MRRRSFVTLLLLAAVSAAAQEVTVSIDATRKASYKIPRTIYGTFLEPIGKSIYGGLWAQILENPSFEENLWSVESIERMAEANPALRRASGLGIPLPWEPLDQAQGARYEPLWNNAANSQRSLLLMALPGAKQTGVRQAVHLPVHRVLTYKGSLYARHVSGPPALEVSLRKRNDPAQVLSRSAIKLTGAPWSKYDFQLELSRGALAPLEAADFVIAASEETRADLDQVFLSPSDAVSGMDPEMVQLTRDMKTPLIRFGGNFTSHYHWKEGVGPMDQRRGNINLAWGMPEYNHFGTDEFLEYCRLVNAEPQLAFNLGTGTPEEAAEWVKYVNARWGDKRGGLLWELGNELWGDFQTGYPTLERVADLTRRFSEAVKKVDPRVRLIATGQDPDHFDKWNGAQLTNPAGTFDMLATHFVVGTGEVRRANADPDFVARAAFALPVELERRLRAMKEQIEASPAHKGKVDIAFTEWLFHANHDRAPRFYNMGGAICTGGMLNTLIRTADFVPVSDMTGIIEFGGIYKKRGRVFGVPAYWAFRMYSTADATQPVEAATDSPVYDITEGNRRLPQIAKVPYLDVVAALNEKGDRLTLFCVNRELHKDTPARIRIAGFSPSGSARVQTLAGTSIYQANTEMRPEAVVPQETMLRTGGAEVQHTFPRSSVTVIEFRR